MQAVLCWGDEPRGCSRYFPLIQHLHAPSVAFGIVACAVAAGLLYEARPILRFLFGALLWADITFFEWLLLP